MPGSAGVVLAGGRSSRMGTPKAALEWHGSTLLRRTTGILARATGGPVVVVRAPGQELPELPPDVEVVDDPREGQGPVQGMAAGLAALADRAGRRVRQLHRHAVPASGLRPPGAARGGTTAPTWCCRWPRLPAAAGRRLPHRSRRSRSGSSPAAGCGRRSCSSECVVSRLGEAALQDDPVLAALDPDLDSVVNVNEPDDYRTARSRPGPEIIVQRFGALANGHRGPQAVRAATVAEAAAAVGVEFGRHVMAALNGDQITRDGQTPLAAGDTVSFLSADAGG